MNHHQLARAELLLDLGADVDERMLLEALEEPTESWGMPLWYAALADDLAMSRLLLDRGADPNANVYASGWPLHKRGIMRTIGSKNYCWNEGRSDSRTWSPQTRDIEETRRMLAQAPTRKW